MKSRIFLRFNIDIKEKMDMKINNNQIENIITVLNDSNSFRNNINIKVPAKIRYALRVNEDKVTPLLKAYNDERQNIIQSFIDNGYITNENGNMKVDKNHLDEVNKELEDLAYMVNDVDFYKIDKDILDDFLEKTDMSVPEERLLLLFT